MTECIDSKLAQPWFINLANNCYSQAVIICCEFNRLICNKPWDFESRALQTFSLFSSTSYKFPHFTKLPQPAPSWWTIYSGTDRRLLAWGVRHDTNGRMDERTEDWQLLVSPGCEQPLQKNELDVTKRWSYMSIDQYQTALSIERHPLA